MRADQIRDYIITYSRCKLIVPAQHTLCSLIIRLLFHVSFKVRKEISRIRSALIGKVRLWIISATRYAFIDKTFTKMTWSVKISRNISKRNSEILYYPVKISLRQNLAQITLNKQTKINITIWKKFQICFICNKLIRRSLVELTSNKKKTKINFI